MLLPLRLLLLGFCRCCCELLHLELPASNKPVNLPSTHPVTAADTRRRQLLSNATTLPGSASGPGVTLAAVPDWMAQDPVYQAAMEGAAVLGDDEGLTAEEALEVQAAMDAEAASEAALAPGPEGAAPSPAPGPAAGEGVGEGEVQVSQMSVRMASPNTLVAWM